MFARLTGARLAVILFVALAAAPASAQQAVSSGPAESQARPLSLADALQMAERQSEALRIAEAGLQRARGQLSQARSGYFPQLTATAAYQRAIQSQFQEIMKASGGGDPEPDPDPAPEPGGDDALGDIGRIFASENTVTLGIQFTQTIWTGGRLTGWEPNSARRLSWTELTPITTRCSPAASLQSPNRRWFKRNARSARHSLHTRWVRSPSSTCCARV